MYHLRLGMIARLLAQDPELYAEISTQNKYTRKNLSIYQKSVKKLVRIIKKKDTNSFVDYFKKAGNFFGDFKDVALEESTELIDQFSKIKSKRD